jgi:hypothetical protein
VSHGDYKIDDGFRVIGRNTSDGALTMWYFPSLKEAQHFAQMLCGETGADVTVTKFLGRWRVAIPPVEFVPEQVELRGSAPTEEETPSNERR